MENIDLIESRIDQAIFEAEQEFAESGEVIEVKVAFEELERARE